MAPKNFQLSELNLYIFEKPNDIQYTVVEIIVHSSRKPSEYDLVKTLGNDIPTFSRVKLREREKKKSEIIVESCPNVSK